MNLVIQTTVDTGVIRQFLRSIVTVPLTKLDADALYNKELLFLVLHKTYKKTVVANQPTTRKIEIPEETKVVKKTVMVTPPTTRTIEIPAEYATISKVVLVKDACLKKCNCTC